MSHILDNQSADEKTQMQTNKTNQLSSISLFADNNVEYFILRVNFTKVQIVW
uniref:Uncharacterized protein n=1 Tax=Arundo donax TaxID=35708 RepID=A0A0A8ZDU8_ARUDO